MASSASGPYLVTRRDDGYGDVIPLQAGQRYTLGRANTNRIVLKDELASRDHAEVYYAENRWPQPDEAGDEATVLPGRSSLGRDLMRLYRLSLSMGSATNYHELADIVLDGLLDAVSAEVGAILTIKEGRQMEITSVRPEGPAKK